MSWAQWYDSDESANAVALDAQKDGGGGFQPWYKRRRAA
jgi:hypothetical protein